MLKETIQKTLKNNKILSVCQIEITDFCNLKCVHCYVCDRTKKQTFNFLNLNTITDVITQLRELNTFHITLTGGEPLSHPNIVEIAHIIKTQNIHLSIMTNGTLINHKLLANLRPYVDKFVITCYGMSQNTYESITRVKGSYSDYTKAIQILKDNKINFVQRAFLLKDNACDADQFAKEKMLIDSNVCIDKSNNYAENTKISLCDQYRLYEQMLYHEQQTVEEINFSKKLDSVVCNACQDSLFINCKGEIEPCVNFNYSLGNIYNDSIINVWTGSARTKFIEKLKLKYFVKCISCDKLMYNTNMCTANYFYETGDMYTPSLYCCQQCNMIYKLVHKKEI